MYKSFDKRALSVVAYPPVLGTARVCHFDFAQFSRNVSHAQIIITILFFIKRLLFFIFFPNITTL